jgi:type III secretory pathway component EscV
MNTFLIVALSLIFICTAWIIRILLVRIEEEKTAKILCLLYNLRIAYRIAFEKKIISDKELLTLINEMNNINCKDILSKGFKDSMVCEDSWKIDLICREFWSEMNDMEKYKLFFGKLAKFEKRYFSKVLLQGLENKEKEESKPSDEELKEKRQGEIYFLSFVGALSFSCILNIILLLKGLNHQVFYFTLLALILNIALLFFVFTMIYTAYFNKNEKSNPETNKPLESEEEFVLDSIEDKPKEEVKPPTSPDQMYGLLGVDALSIHVGKDLIDLADPEKGGQLVPDIGLLRQHMTLIYGYILPPVRIADNRANGPYQYNIVVRGNTVSSSEVYPNRYMILKSHWDRTFDGPPPEFIEGIEPTLKEKAYWLKADYLNKLVEDKSWTEPYLTAVQAITYHLMETVIANIEDLFTKADLRRVLDQVRETDSVLVDNVLNVLSISTLRKVLINLIREKVSIKDIHYILENLEDLATETTNADLLSEKLRILLARQISATNAIDNKKILAIKLDSDLEDKLTEFLQIVNHQAILVLPPEQAVSLVRKIVDISRDINSEYNRRPVVLTATPSVRLPLARLIHGSENQTAVMGYAELSSDFRPEVLNTVGLNDLVGNNFTNKASSEEEKQTE